MNETNTFLFNAG